jgi:hypothetical protein
MRNCSSLFTQTAAEHGVSSCWLAGMSMRLLQHKQQAKPPRSDAVRDIYLSWANAARHSLCDCAQPRNQACNIAAAHALQKHLIGKNNYRLYLVERLLRGNAVAPFVHSQHPMGGHVAWLRPKLGDYALLMILVLCLGLAKCRVKLAAFHDCICCQGESPLPPIFRKTSSEGGNNTSNA